MKVFFFVIVLPTGKIKPSLTPTCFPSFFSSHTRLLTPTPFLSALFKSKQKTHLVCLLAPSFSYFLSVEQPPSFFSLKLFSAASIRVKDNILLTLRAGRRRLVGGTVACLTFFASIHIFMDTNSWPNFIFSGRNVFKNNIFWITSIFIWVKTVKLIFSMGASTFGNRYYHMTGWSY